MRSIWKFMLSVEDTQTVSMPIGAQILDVQLQGEQLCIWALVDTTAEKEDRVFELYGTGHPFRDGEQNYIGTFQVYSGTLIFHLFERV